MAGDALARRPMYKPAGRRPAPRVGAVPSLGAIGRHPAGAERDVQLVRHLKAQAELLRGELAATSS